MSDLPIPDFAFGCPRGVLCENKTKKKWGEEVSVLSSCKHEYKVSHRHSRRLINQMEQRDSLPELVMSYWAKPHAEEMKNKRGQKQQADGFAPPWEKVSHGAEGNYAMKDGILRGTVTMMMMNANIRS